MGRRTRVRQRLGASPLTSSRARAPASPVERKGRGRLNGWVLLGVASVGLLAALALPFAPVFADRTVVTWPAGGQATESSTVQLVPYRPTELSASVPCTAVAAALARGEPTTILATANDAEGLVLRAENGRLLILPGNRQLELRPAGPDCALTVHAARGVIEVGGSTPTPFTLEGPVPKVFTFRTALSPAEAAGLSVTVQVDNQFATSPTGIKLAFAAIALVAVGIALALLHRASGGEQPRAPPRDEACRSWRLRAVDVGVVALLCGWAVVGPLAVDDGWATTIARNFAETGTPGNYYRWWNAPESPFALSQQLLAPLTQISLAPLWLRLPSTLLGVATWFVLSRGVLGAALPSTASTLRVRLLASIFFAAAWLPYDLGTRPEPYVAFGLAVVLALTWRARTVAALGWAMLAFAATVPISPSAIMLAAPMVAFLPRAVTILRGAASGRVHLAGLVALLCCIGGVAIVVVFVDQTWHGLLVATQWHNDFGPSLPWYQEYVRYGYLFGDDQQGSAAKRAPVLLSLALIPVIAAHAVLKGGGNAASSAAARLAGMVVGALLLLALTPSKWSYHFGAAAPLFAALLTVAVVAIVESVASRQRERTGDVIAGCGAVLVAAAAAFTFAGPNAWWMDFLYDVPWADEAIRPLGLPLDSFSAIIGVTVAAVIARVAFRKHVALMAIPAIVAVIAAAVSVAVLVGSFVAAPIRRPAGSLAMINVARLTGGPYCGLADSIEVLADGAPLERAGPSGPMNGFVAMGGFDPAAPPPDAPGTGISSEIWGSRTGRPDNRGQLISPWFALSRGTSISTSVNGRIDGPNSVALEFGGGDGPGVNSLGDVTPPLPRPTGDNSVRPAWRTIGVDTAQIPDGADRVRIRAVDDGTAANDWLAMTGPRTTTAMPLNDFLTGRSPVLVGWPLAFLFPCVKDIPRVSGGVAQVPRVVLKSPGPWFTEPTDQSLGGSFATLRPYGRLYEVRSRIVGHPDLDWGSVLVSADTTGHDAYDRRDEQQTRLGK